MRPLLLILILLFGLEASAKEKKYPVRDIPEHLMENAHAVIRLDDRKFEIHDPARATFSRKYVITIFNSKAQYHGHFVYPYSGKSNLTNFSGTVYNSAGEEIDRIKKSDLQDKSHFDGFSIISDNRYLEVDYNHQEYPYTIEYEYSEAYTAMMWYPKWVPQGKKMLSIIKSTYEVVLPKSMTLRYKELNLESPVTTQTIDDLQIYTWKVENLPAVNSSDVGPNWTELTPTVLIGPHKFTFGGYSGDMSSWENLGKWQYQLNAELGELPAGTVTKIKALVADAPDQKEKIKRIYNYLQENTRYVSIQLGIGGWQPFPPDFVDENGYGDCKALSFYTKSMLQSVGINSHYTLVRAGEDIPILYSDFPSRQFNHVFLCVPMEQDTIWLECTSQTNPFGYLGTFTSDRDVLLVTEDGGKMVHTPALRLDQNQLITSGEITVNQDGSATANLNMIYKGYFSEYVSRLLLKGSDEQKKWVYNNLSLPTFNINKMNFSKSGEQTPQVQHELELDLRKLATLSGKRMFVQPNLLHKQKWIPGVFENRKTDIVIKYNKQWVDTLTFQVPEQYHPEYIPEVVKLENDFGSYMLEVTAQPGSITFLRKLELRKGRYAPEVYKSYRKFYEQMVKSDKTKIVLKNTT